jgi:hypothetical protein
MAKFVQRSDVAMFLVAQGFDVSKVKVAVDQGYNYEKDNDLRDLCYRSIKDADFIFNDMDATADDMRDEHRPTFVTEEDAIMMYRTFDEMITVTDVGIEVDGELLYDLNGDMLDTPKKPVLNSADAAQFQVDAAKTRFAIETSNGFWNRDTSAFHKAVENASYFTWLEQEDHLTEAMEEIAATSGAWFKVICVTAFDK